MKVPRHKHTGRDDVITVPRMVLDYEIRKAKEEARDEALEDAAQIVLCRNNQELAAEIRALKSKLVEYSADEIAESTKRMIAAMAEREAYSDFSWLIDGEVG